MNMTSRKGMGRNEFDELHTSDPDQPFTNINTMYASMISPSKPKLSDPTSISDHLPPVSSIKKRITIKNVGVLKQIIQDLQVKLTMKECELTSATAQVEMKDFQTEMDKKTID